MKYVLTFSSLMWYSVSTTRKDESNVQVSPILTKRLPQQRKDTKTTNIKDLTSENEPQQREEHSLTIGSKG